MKEALEALEEIYLAGSSYVSDVEDSHSPEIVRYILNLKLADWFMNESQHPILQITNKGINVLQEYEIID